MLSPHDLVVGYFKDELIRVQPISMQLMEETISVSSIVELITPHCAPGYRPDSQDVMSQVVQSKWMLSSYYRFKQFLVAQDLGVYDQVKFDCDDFAINYWVWCRNIYAKQPDTKAETSLIGVCKYPGHVLNFAITEQGLQFFEPQTGKFVPKPQGIYWMQF